MRDQEIKESLAVFSRLISEAEEEVKEHIDISDITASQLNYMEAIGVLDNPTITELAIALNVKKPSVTIVVERLISKGYAYKVQSDTDKRVAHLHLTELGKQINQRHDYAHHYLTQLITSKLNEQEQDEFVRIINKIMATS